LRRENESEPADAEQAGGAITPEAGQLRREGVRGMGFAERRNLCAIVRTLGLVGRYTMTALRTTRHLVILTRTRSCPVPDTSPPTHPKPTSRNPSPSMS